MEEVTKITIRAEVTAGAAKALEEVLWQHPGVMPGSTLTVERD